MSVELTSEQVLKNNAELIKNISVLLSEIIGENKLEQKTKKEQGKANFNIRKIKERF
jgi:hypothetical protein